MITSMIIIWAILRKCMMHWCIYEIYEKYIYIYIYNIYKLQCTFYFYYARAILAPHFGPVRSISILQFILVHFSLFGPNRSLLVQLGPLLLFQSTLSISVHFGPFGWFWSINENRNSFFTHICTILKKPKYHYSLFHIHVYIQQY